MKSAYNDLLIKKYGIEEEDAEIITELKRRIRKISPLAKEQKTNCEVCNASEKNEPIYNHHIMKVEYLAILCYYYDLYKKQKNPNYVENRGSSEQEINTQSEKEFIYVLKKDTDLYIPRVAICERHHNMLHELAGDFEGDTNKHYLGKAKPKELKYLYDTLHDQDIKIYENIFKDSDDLEGREYYVSYLKIWNDTLDVAMHNLDKEIEKRLEFQRDDIGEKNVQMLTKLKEDVDMLLTSTEGALEGLDPKFQEEGDEEITLSINSLDEPLLKDSESNEEKEIDFENLTLNDLDKLKREGAFSDDEMEELYISFYSRNNALNNENIITNINEDEEDEEDEI